MSTAMQQIYWRLPYPMKCWAASWNARKLDRQRHGRLFSQEMEKIKSRNHWTSEQFYKYQCDHLYKMINHAASNVPYYKKIFAEGGINPGQIKSPDDLVKLPILEKSIVRSAPECLIDENADSDKLIEAHTSGTTGNPLELSRDIWMNSVDFAYNTARWHNVVGLQRSVNRSVSLGGHLVTSSSRTKPPFWVENKRWNQLYMSSYHLSPKNLGFYVDKIRRFKPEYIEGYPSSVHAVAKHIVDSDLEPITLKAVFTTAEMLYDFQRDDIKKAFCCHTYNQYGCAEQVVFAAECQAGNMHISPEVGIVEVIGDDDKRLPKGEAGQLICTSLINFAQPFIRYRMGDVAAISEETGCPCGSHMPILKDICGREADLIYSTERGAIGSAGLSTAFYSTSGAFEVSQIAQVGIDTFEFRYICNEEASAQVCKSMLEQLHRRLGNSVQIDLKKVREIPRTKAGKFRPVVNEVSK